MNDPRPSISPLGLLPSLLIFGGAGLILFLETRFLIPYLSAVTGVETVIWWFLVAAMGMFTPLLVIAFIMLKREGRTGREGLWKERLRFRRMTARDWIWGLGGIFMIGLGSYFIMAILSGLAGPVDSQPPFMQFEPLGPGRYWILLVWLPYWVFNIMGEEILWRGVLLPRQEISFGNQAWLIHGMCWSLFHVAFGWQLLVTLLPILFVQSYIVQKRKNSWIGVLIHAGINGPSFVAISLGWI